MVPELQGGIGGANLKFYFPNSCGTLGCSGSTYLQSANHFQVQDPQNTSYSVSLINPS